MLEPQVVRLRRGVALSIAADIEDLTGFTLLDAIMLNCLDDLQA